MCRTACSTAVLVFLVLGCAPPAEPPAAEPEPAVDLEAARASLLEADRSWAAAYAASDSPADVFAQQVVDDATLLPPGAPLAEGREAIREAIADLEEIPEFSVSWGPSSAHVARGGDLGYTIGSYEMKMTPEDRLLEFDGKYLTVWRRQADGAWMVEADMFNANGPPSPVGE